VASISLKNITKRYGKTDVLHGIDLDIADGEFTVFVGPSGCGKSTLLRVICGLEEISDGDILFDDTLCNGLMPASRGVSMVFQSYALYPHMTVYDNLAFGLRVLKLPRGEIDARVHKAADILNMGQLLKRRPGQLSGGQAQRVAIGRAIVKQPRVFLFDEPLSNLDAELRVKMRVEIARLHKTLGTTMVYVTHDQTEAMTMADKIVVMRDGRIEQAGTPIELYTRPATLFVAGFIGSPSMNFFRATVEHVNASTVGVLLPSGGRVEVAIKEASCRPDDVVTLGVRPEHLEITSDTGEEMIIETVELLGIDTLVHGRIDGSESSTTISLRGIHDLAEGDLLRLRMPSASCHLFSEAGDRITDSAEG